MERSHRSNTLGIDFGTSNSAAGILVNDTPYLIEVEAGENTLPTSVFFDFETRKTHFGSVANKALMQGDEGRFMRSLKSVLGTSLMHEKRRMMGETLTFTDIISRFLAEMKSRAEAACYQSFDYALSGRPVHFHSNSAAKDQQALKDLRACYLQAGFKDVQFLYEPEAAAIANGDLAHDNSLGLIVDIGGGTSDFTLFQMRQNGAKNAASRLDVIASHGVRIGGTNFDKTISVDHVMPLFGKGSYIRKEMGAGALEAPNAMFNELATWEKIPFLYTKETLRTVEHFHRLAMNKPLFVRLNSVLEHQLAHEVAFAVERGKIQANKAGPLPSKIDLGFVEPELAAALSSENLVSSLAEHAANIQACALETLKMAECDAARVDTVIFVGGSSLMTVVIDAMKTLFPKAQLQHKDAFTAIVNGLAIASSQAFNNDATKG